MRIDPEIKLRLEALSQIHGVTKAEWLRNKVDAAWEKEVSKKVHKK